MVPQEKIIETFFIIFLLEADTQLTIACSNLTTETLEQGVKYVQSP